MPLSLASRLHPAALIALWATYVVGLELLAWSGVAIAAIASFPILLHTQARTRFLQLVWRSRWILWMLPLTYAFSVPGQPIWPGFNVLSWPGVDAGALRVARLLLMLVALAWLLSALDVDRLILGLYTLAKPLARLGVDIRALAVRLSLVMEGAQHRVSRKKPWQLVLDDMEAAPPAGPLYIVLQPQAWSWRDAAALLVAAGFLGALLA